MNYRFAALFFLIATAASPAPPQVPTKASTPAKPAEPPKPKMTKAQKLAAWNGQRVTILGKEPLRCPNQSGEFDSDLRKFEEKNTYARLRIADYVGQTGVIREINSADRGAQRLIDLDNGQRLLIGDRRYLGFQEELQAAQGWIGRNLWLKNYTWSTTDYSLVPGDHLCPALSSPEMPNIPILAKLTITGTEFGTTYQPILLQVKTEDGQSAWLRPALHVFFLEQFSDDQYRPFADAFYLDDPQKKHANWSATVWKLIRERKVAVGMTEEQAMMACGGEMNARGFFLVGEAVSTIYGCFQNKDFLVENGKVKEYVEFRRVP